MTEPPDYYCGRLLYQDPENPHLWIIYDGREKHVFISKERAQVWALANSQLISQEYETRLTRIWYGLTKYYLELDEVAAKNLPNLRLELEKIALDLRRLAFELDTLIKQNNGVQDTE